MLKGEMEYSECTALAKAIYQKMLTIYTLDSIMDSGKFDDESARLSTIRRIEVDSIRDLNEIFNRCIY